MKKKPNPELLDADNPEWSAQDVAKARPASEVLPQLFGAKVVQHFKAAGDGWQIRIDLALRQFISEHASR